MGKSKDGNVTYFMYTQMRIVGLGTSPGQAFYVRCDEETNPREIRDAGYCVVEVGLAPVRPAEFVVLQIGQWEGGTAVAELYLTP